LTKSPDTPPVTNAQARKTALIVAGVLLLLAGWQYFRHRPTAGAVLALTGATLAIIGFLFPPLARAFHTIWMRFATLLGWINSRILLGLMFYGVFAPYNLIGRLIRRDPLRRRGRAQDSYWIPRKATRQTREQFERTF
jgi:glucan phosphoethanolaminetransferase (alkaline phosphatase superfamily)